MVEQSIRTEGSQPMCRLPDRDEPGCILRPAYESVCAQKNANFFFSQYHKATSLQAIRSDTLHGWGESAKKDQLGV